MQNSAFFLHSPHRGHFLNMVSYLFTIDVVMLASGAASRKRIGTPAADVDYRPAAPAAIGPELNDKPLNLSQST